MKIPAYQEWMERSACRDADPELFYLGEQEREPYKSRRIADAKAMCAGCPVVAECLAYALATETASTRHGIWGGLDEQERAALDDRPRRTVAPRRPRKLTKPPCGTERGYRAHKRDGEPVCEPCRAAQADYQRAIRARRKEKVA